MSLLLCIVFCLLTGTEFCSSCHFCSVLKTVSKSQRAVLNAVVWPNIFLFIKRGEKKNLGGGKAELIDSLRILKVEER